MQRKSITMAVGGALVLAAVATSPTWTATIAATDGSTIAGSATVAARDHKPMTSTDTAATRPMAATGYTASISVTGAKPKASLAWHVHQGHCAASGAVVGAESAYPNLMIDERGSAQATASIDAALAEGKDYSVNVHSGGSVIACGNLSSGKKAMP